MLKDIINSNESKNLHDDDIEYLKRRFPGCFTKEIVDYDGNVTPSKFDIEKFRQLINPQVDITQEGYGLNFLGKTYARYISSLESETVLVPDTEHNSQKENEKSENLYISGDNIDALKHLLKSYEQSIKCIYIDPPYNTGSDDFVYKDNFTFRKDDLQQKLNLSSEQAERVLDLTNRGSSSHSAWLMFMYPRLLLAPELLKDDGVIFISIDDNEQSDLKLLCDDVFGEENFVSEFVVIKTEGGGMAKQVIKGHDYLLTYARNISSFSPLGKEKDVRGRIIERDGERFWVQEDWFRKEFGKYGNCHYEEILECKGQEKLNEINIGIKQGIYQLIPKDNGMHIVGKLRNLKEDSSKFYSILKHLSADGIENLTELKLEKCFSYPKPVSLVQEMVLGSTFFSDSDIILDFFSGSATTAHAVMQLNAEDQRKGKAGNRKYIMVQLPEDLDEKLKKADAKGKEIIRNAIELTDQLKKPHTLDQIGMERIKRAASKIKSENTDLFTQENALDFGFKHYTVKSASQNTLDKLEKFTESTLVSDNTILNEFAKETVLATWMNTDGYGLTSKYHEVKLCDYTAYLCEKHLYFVDAGLSEKDVQALCKKYEEESQFNPDKIVIFGYSFTMSVLETLKTNLKVLKKTEKNLDITFDIRY